MIDLHVHSTASDGTCTPSEIAAMGRDCRVLALTDHDTAAGLPEFMSAEPGPAVRIPGMELSLVPGEGFGRYHLLALGVDASHPALSALVKRAAEGRVERNPRIIAKLAALGIDVSMEEVAKEAGGEVIARPHIARVLLKKGCVTSIKEAFDLYLADGRPAFAERWRPSPAEAFAAIHAAGGVAVMAHPKYWAPDPEKFRSGIVQQIELGLDGVEAVYSANTIDETRLHLSVARESGLLVTAGSDFHGDNKPNVAFGMDIHDEDALVRPLLRRLGML